MSLEKAALMIPAAVLAHASVLSKSTLYSGGATAAIAPPASGPIDPTITDPNLRNLNLEVWEEARIFYHAIVGAFNDDVQWPAPNMAVAAFNPSSIANYVQQLLPALLPVLGTVIGGPAGGAITSAITSIVSNLNPPKTLPPVTVPPAAPIPNPGSVTPAPSPTATPAAAK